MITKSHNKFFIVSGGYTVGWAGKFDTRREAEEWLNQDHDWEERTEVVFEGDTVGHTCGACKAFTDVDDLAGEEDFEPRWLCVNCQ
jgi:hypothetical protein